MKTLTITFLSLALLASCSKESNDLVPASVSSAIEKSQNAKPRPFSATLNAVADPNSPPTPCTGAVPFAAPDFFLTGDVTHLGGIDPQLSVLHHVSCDVNVATMLLTTSVTVDLVAANGDILSISGDDVVNIANLLTGGDPTGSITGTWTVTGGTGRFEGATGSISINGTVDFATNTFTCAAVGTISY